MSARRIATLTLAAALAVWPSLLSRLPVRYRPVVAAATSTALAGAAGTPLGLRPPQLRSGLAVGAVAAAITTLAVGVVAAAPPVRRSMRERQLDLPPLLWLGLHIPVGTVWSEEVAFRGVLQPLATGAFGKRAGTMLQAAAFGLAHIRPARMAGDPVLPTVLVTAAAGWILGWLRGRSGSVVAPILAHLALNESAAVAALAAQRRPL